MLCLLWSGYANADDRGFSSARSYIELSSFSYAEPGLMTKTATSPVLGAGITDVDLGWPIPISHSVGLKVGQTDYQGSGRTSGDPLFVLDYQANIGTALAGIDGHLGLGYRLLYDDWGDQRTSTGQLTYDRKSEYIYLAAGIEVPLNQSWSSAVELRSLISGMQTVHFPLELGGSSHVMRQREGFGLRTEMTFEERYSFFVDLWDVARSENASASFSLYEPANTTISVGVRYSLR